MVNLVNPDELLILVSAYNDGSTYVIETEKKAYTREAVQHVIDSYVSEHNHIVIARAMNPRTGYSHDLSESLDLRSWAEWKVAAE